MSLDIQDDQLQFKICGEQTYSRTPIVEGSFELAAAVQLSERLISEEVVMELLPALRNYELMPSLDRLTEVYDGCIDSIYVILNCMNTLGLPFQEGWDEVQRSNMSKFVDGKVIKNAAGKVLKPDSFSPPDLRSILAARLR